MSRIETISDKSSIQKTWEHIFKSNDPFSIPFQPDIEAYLLLPFTPGCSLTSAQYRAVTGAARTVGDQGFVLSEIESDDFFNRLEHWWCEFPTYEDYLTLGTMIENAMYSINSHWGIMFSHEWHAVVGGSESFIRNVDKIYPEWRTCVIEYIDGWKWEVVQGVWVVDMFIELIDYWKKYPGDEWSAEVAEKFNSKLHGRR